MDKSLLSQLLDGAAFPAIMLAVAVSQIRVGPNQRNTLHQDEKLAAEVQPGDRALNKKLNKRRDIKVLVLPRPTDSTSVNLPRFGGHERSK